MAQFNKTGYKGLPVSAAVAQYVLVKISSSKVATAGLAEQPIGVSMQQGFADGDVINVALLSKAGTIKMKCADAVAEGAAGYGRASGLIDDVSTSSAIKVGVALEAATATNDIIEVMPFT